MNHIPTDKQWGFRSARSTTDAGSNLLDSILHGLNSNRCLVSAKQAGSDSRKSKIMHFKPTNTSQSMPSAVVLDGSPLETVSSYKYLGYIIDERLTFKELLSNTIGKLNHILSIFRKVCPALSLKASIAKLKFKFISYIDYICLFSFMLNKKVTSAAEFLHPLRI